MAGSEIAYFSLSSKEINILKRKKQPAFRRILHSLEQPSVLKTSISIANTFSNVGLIITANLLINSWTESTSWENTRLLFFIKWCGVTFFLVLFAEILPKIWATHHAIWFALTSSLLVEIANSFLYRLSHKIIILYGRLEQKSSSDTSENQENSQHDDLIESLPDNETGMSEKQMLKGIRKFARTEVKQVMRSRLDVSGLEYAMSFKEVILMTKELHYSRLPVFKNNLDDIVGILHTKDLLPYLGNEDQLDWHTFIRDPYFVHEHKLIEDLLQEFRQKRIHFAIVADEFGGTSGIVTMEDIVEEVTGEIKDEYDDEESINKKIDDDNYILEGKTMINDLCKIMNLPVKTFDSIRGDSDSLAGLVLEIAGAFPNVSDKVTYKNFTFTPIEINRNRIEKVQITIERNKAI